MNGLATAGGCQIVLACDLITASPKSALGMTGLKVGMFCGTPGVELIRSLPSTKKTLEMLLVSEPMPAEQAYKLGVINRIFKEEELDEKTLEFAN